MSHEQDDLLKRIEEKHLSSARNAPENAGWRGKITSALRKVGDAVGGWLERHTKLVTIGLSVMMAVFVLVFLLAKDYLTKRQNFPERNVLFRATNVLYVSGGSEVKGTKSTDQLSETQVYEGGLESKVGTFLFTTTRNPRRHRIFQHGQFPKNPRRLRYAQAGSCAGGAASRRQPQFQRAIRPNHRGAARQSPAIVPRV